MFRRSLISLACISFALTAVGCSVSKNAQTSAENSGRAADNGGRAADNSGAMLELATTGYGDSRQGNTSLSRTDAIRAMLDARTVDAKLVYAATYFNGLEYQLFKGTGFREDDTAKLDTLLVQAISATLKLQKDFTPIAFDPVTAPGRPADDGSITQTIISPSPLSEILKLDGSISGSPLNALALASALHTVSERQREAGARYGVAPRSLLDVFSDVMAQKAAADADPAVLANAPKHVYEALRASGDVEYLLNLRANVMAGSALRIVSQAATVTADKGLQIQATAAQLQDASDRLKAALQVKQILGKAGIAIKFLPDVRGGMDQVLAGTAKIPGAVMDAAKSSPKQPKYVETLGLLGMLAK